MAFPQSGRFKPKAKSSLLGKRRPRIKTKSKGRTKRGSAVETLEQLQQLRGELEKCSAYKLSAVKLATNLANHLRYLAEELPHPTAAWKMASVLEETGNLRTALDQAYPAYTPMQKAALVVQLLKSLDHDMKKMALATMLQSAIKQAAAIDMAMGEGMASPEDPMQQQQGVPQQGAPLTDQMPPQPGMGMPGAMPPPGAPPMDPSLMGQQQPMPPQAAPPPAVPGAVPPPPYDQPLPPQALQPTPPSTTTPAQSAMFDTQALGGITEDPAAAIMADPPDSISTDKMGSITQRLARLAARRGR